MTAVAPPQTAAPTSLTAIRGDGYPPLNAPPKTLAAYVQSLLQDSEAEAQSRYRLATQYLLFADGRQHIEWNLRDKTWKDTPDTRIRVTMNYIKPILRSRAQRLLSSELSWRAIPRSNAHEERDRAAVATNLLESRWNAEEMDAKARQAVFLADCCGVCYLKKYWNPAIGPLTPATMVLPHPATNAPTSYPVAKDGQPLMDDRGDPLDGTDLAYTYRPGDTDTALRTIFNVRLNPDAQGLEPGEGFRWLLDSEVVPVSVVKERWGERASAVKPTSGFAQMRQYQNIVKSIIGVTTPGSPDTATGRVARNDKDLVLLTEYWEAPSDPLQTGRLIVLAGDEVLYPRPDLGDVEGLPQGKLMFAAVYSERRPFDPGGRAVVADLIAPQRVVNSQWSGILQEQALHGAGQWIGFDVPGMFDQISNLDNAQIRIPMNSAVLNRDIGSLVSRVPPPQVSPDRWRLLEAALKVMFDIGAFHEIQRGQVPPGVDSGIAVQLLQEAENGQMHDSVRGLKRAFIQWGRLTGHLAKWGYGKHEERWIPQQRPDLAYLVEAATITGEDLPDFDTLDIDLEGFRPHSQAALNAEIKEMMGQGWIDPRQGLKLMDLGRGVEGAFESQNRHYARARRENLAIQKKQYQVVPTPPHSPTAALGVVGSFLHLDGMSFLLPQDDDPLIHIDVHQEIFLDDTRPKDERLAAGMHIAEHRAVLQQTILAQQAAANPPAPDAKSKPKPNTTPPTSGASDA